ncbi:MAG: hypothetical protein WBX15_16250 [Thermoanaerobaculia bacterium]
MVRRSITLALAFSFVTLSLVSAANSPSPSTTTRFADVRSQLAAELTAKYGDTQRERLERGMEQVASFWRAEDGDADAFASFIRSDFAGDPTTLDAMFDRFQSALEQLDGNMLEINRKFREQVDLDRGPILPMDQIMSAWDPSAHVNDDFFQNKLAFVALLNFPLTTLDERLTDGKNWSRRHWAEVRLAQRFSHRVPAEVNQDISAALSDADAYIAEYNIWMHHLLTNDGRRLFPAKLRLISHWNLRDELKADYSDPAGLEKQQMIEKVMERIVTQTIPAAVINNPNVDWNPYTNEVKPTSSFDGDTPAPPAHLTAAREPDTRYAKLLGVFHATQKEDAYSPNAPTLIDRRFNEDREIPEARVEAMFEQIVASPLVPKVAALIEKRLGRKLQPFDIWYNGFRQRGQYTEAQLDAITSGKYPTAAAYGADIPNILEKLGFSPERARYVAANIVVDPARGAGHAMGAARRGDKAHLRTRVEKEGMNYKGYNIAVHEMGHNVEQTFSLDDIDYTLLEGVPNTAFTEALAFVFQNRDLELLGLAKPGEEARALSTLNEFWGAYEIAGVALVDMRVWHWMYAHPNATPAELREATVQISKDLWNQYYAPVFGQKDVVLLGIYSHMIDAMLYLPDYPIGHMIAYQIEEQMEKSGKIGPEFERMAKIGSVVPDLWMTEATGKPVGPEALLAATKNALGVER